MPEVVITEPAKMDMVEIQDYLLHRLFNPLALENLKQAVLRAFHVLETSPEAYPECDDPRLRASGYRKCVLGGYLFVYKISEDGNVYVVRFFHGSQNWQQYL